jgi:hypothetical protein
VRYRPLFHLAYRSELLRHERPWSVIQLRDNEKGPCSIKAYFFINRVSHYYTSNMSLLIARLVLGEISSNITRGKELTFKLKG